MTMATRLINAIRSAWYWLGQQPAPNCSASGWRAFQAGLFWMPSSAFIGGVLLLLSLTLWAPGNQPKPLQRPVARVLLALASLMVVTTLAAAPALTLEQQLRVMNWLPFFWFFLAMRPYLGAAPARNRIAMALVAGTVPIAVLGLTQAALGFSGPWTALGGLLEWPLPALYSSRGSGAFPNPNFTAAWYAIVLPLAAAQLLRWRAPANGPEHKIAAQLSLGVLMLIALALYVCSSRNALLAAPLALLALSWQVFALPVLIGGLSLAALLALALWGGSWGGASGALTQAARWLTGYLTPKFGAVIAQRAGTASDPLRQELYPKAFEFISAHPWLGGGERLLPGSPESLSQPIGLTHLHSLPLQFAINHGLPALVVFTGLVSWLSLQAIRRMRQQHHNRIDPTAKTDRSLVVAAFTAIWLHVLDIPSFDSRINVLGWVLLGCLQALSAPPPPKAGHSAQPAQT